VQSKQLGLEQVQRTQRHRRWHSPTCTEAHSHTHPNDLRCKLVAPRGTTQHAAKQPSGFCGRKGRGPRPMVSQCSAFDTGCRFRPRV